MALTLGGLLAPLSVWLYSVNHTVTEPYLVCYPQTEGKRLPSHMMCRTKSSMCGKLNITAMSASMSGTRRSQRPRDYTCFPTWRRRCPSSDAV